MMDTKVPNAVQSVTGSNSWAVVSVVVAGLATESAEDDRSNNNQLSVGNADTATQFRDEGCFVVVIDDDENVRWWLARHNGSTTRCCGCFRRQAGTDRAGPPTKAAVAASGVLLLVIVVRCLWSDSFLLDYYYQQSVGCTGRMPFVIATKIHSQSGKEKIRSVLQLDVRVNGCFRGPSS